MLVFVDESEDDRKDLLRKSGYSLRRKPLELKIWWQEGNMFPLVVPFH